MSMHTAGLPESGLVETQSAANQFTEYALGGLASGTTSTFTGDFTGRGEQAVSIEGRFEYEVTNPQEQSSCGTIMIGVVVKNSYGAVKRSIYLDKPGSQDRQFALDAHEDRLTVMVMPTFSGPGPCTSVRLVWTAKVIALN